MINHLQMMRIQGDRVTMGQAGEMGGDESLMGKTQEKRNIFELYESFFSEKPTSVDAKLDAFFQDPDMMPLMVQVSPKP